MERQHVVLAVGHEVYVKLLSGCCMSSRGLRAGTGGMQAAGLMEHRLLIACCGGQQELYIALGAASHALHSIHLWLSRKRETFIDMG